MLSVEISHVPVCNMGTGHSRSYTRCAFNSFLIAHVRSGGLLWVIKRGLASKQSHITGVQGLLIDSRASCHYLPVFLFYTYSNGYSFLKAVIPFGVMFHKPIQISSCMVSLLRWSASAGQLSYDYSHPVLKFGGFSPIPQAIQVRSGEMIVLITSGG